MFRKARTESGDGTCVQCTPTDRHKSSSAFFWELHDYSACKLLQVCTRESIISSLDARNNTFALSREQLAHLILSDFGKPPQLSTMPSSFSCFPFSRLCFQTYHVKSSCFSWRFQTCIVVPLRLARRHHISAAMRARQRFASSCSLIVDPPRKSHCSKARLAI